MQETTSVNCPYCGESFDTFVDISAGSQDYWEDCAVCCKPILFQVHIKDDANVEVFTLREDD